MNKVTKELVPRAKNITNAFEIHEKGEEAPRAFLRRHRDQMRPR